MTPPRRFVIAGLLAALPAFAEAGDSPGRDPMQAPTMATAERADTHTPGATDASAVRHLMVINGRRYIIEGGQRLGVGDRLGDARIERIDDGVVWLRDARGLRQASLFGGIVKRPAPDSEATVVRRATAQARRRTQSTTQLASAPDAADKLQKPVPGTPSPR